MRTDITLHHLGFTTDGEFNSLRTMGAEGPISIVGLIQLPENRRKIPVSKLSRSI